MVAKEHAMVEVPVRDMLTQQERITLTQDEQTALVNKRADNIRQSLYANYMTRHMANRIVTQHGVMYVRRSYHSLMRGRNAE